MAVDLILETGTADNLLANSYASVAEADAYFVASQFAATWAGLTTDQKSILLISATRQIDALFQFNGSIVKGLQPLQWPRFQCVNPDAQPISWPVGLSRNLDLGMYFPPGAIPTLLKVATYETAKAMNAGDRTGDNQSNGLSRVSIFQGIDVTFNGEVLKPVIPEYVQTLLTKVGSYRQGGGGPVKLRRA